MQPDKLLSIAEAMVYARQQHHWELSRWKLNQLIDAGTIATYPMLDNRKKGIRPADIDTYIAQYQPIRADLSKYVGMQLLVRKNSKSDHITKYYLYQDEDGILYFVITGEEGVELERTMSLDDAVHLGLIETDSE
jgi:hypothetical protein